MIHLHLPIRRLVTGAIFLATCGAVTPASGGGPVNGEGKPAICGLGGGRGEAPRLVREAAGNSVFGRQTIVTAALPPCPPTVCDPETGIGRILWLQMNTPCALAIAAQMTPTPTPAAIVVRSAEASAEWNSPVQAPALRPTTPSTPTAVGVSPSAIDENFRGFVEVTINGLATGDTIRLEKFQVNNSTGVIDANAILEQSLLLTDGVSNQIGGISNVNVPADTTAADGTIVAQIPFLDSSVPTTVGEYVFRFSSPTNSFAALTARFTVSNVPDAQDITGQVTANGVPVPNAYVVLLDTHGGSDEFIAGTIADATGHYTFGAAPGQYDMVAAHRGFVGAFRGTEQILGANEHKVVNLTMEAGTRTISGQVRDSQTNAGLPAVQVLFRTDTGKFTVDYTDANGNFSTSVTPDKWNVEVERKAVNQLGYLAPYDGVAADTSTGNKSNVNLSLAKATTLLYGTVRDSSNAPVAGLDLAGADDAQHFQAAAVTDPSGNYVMGISDGVWTVDAITSGTRQALAPLPTKLYTAEGQATHVDFAASESSAQLSGALKDNNGAGISDITYEATRVVAGNIGQLVRFGTQDDGSFSVGLSAGTWSIFPLPETAANQDVIVVGPTSITLTEGQNLTGFTLQAIRPTRHVNVTVNDQNGTPRPSIELALGYSLNNQFYFSSAFTDEHGMASLPAYDYDQPWYLTGQPANLAASGFRNFAAQTVTVSGSDVNVTVTLEPLPPTGNTLVNLSTRGTVQTGDNVLIGGFIVPGLAPKRLAIRAIGPSLAGSGVSGFLSDPTLTLFDNSGAQIGFNDDWMNSPDRQAIIDAGLAPTNDKESVVLQTLVPGIYTAKIAGAGNVTGVALIELYDLQSFSSSTLANISTRGRVDQGENVLIAGYIVGGYSTERVVVRGIGPSLTQSGVSDALPDPVLELHDGQGTTIAFNDDWRDTQEQELIDTGIPPTDPLESAIVINLQPGNYTSVMSGYNGATGVALAEVYNITHNF